MVSILIGLGAFLLVFAFYELVAYLLRWRDPVEERLWRRRKKRRRLL